MNAFMLNLAKKIYGFAMRIACPMLDFRSRYYLKRLKKLPKSFQAEHQRIKVAFLVFEPESWDKQKPVYDELLLRPNFVVEVVVVPGFNDSFSVKKEYGAEKVFFEKECSTVRLAYDPSGILADLYSDPYDYVFYGDPYNRHMPRKLRSYNMVKYSKICYIPYGFSGSAVFDDIADNAEFHRNVYLNFVDSQAKETFFKDKFSNSIQKGLQRVEYLGYPALEKYFLDGGHDYTDGDVLRVAWTPRWSYDRVIGGSHFLEYKDGFLSLGYDEGFELTLRPHPMMFTELASKGLFSRSQAKLYCEELCEEGVNLSKDGVITDVLLDTDVLITDYSSIIIMFFLTGRPIIYCDSAIPFNESFSLLKRGLYVASSWDEVVGFLNDIRSGNDYLRGVREEIVEKEFGLHRGAASRIVDCIEDDFRKSLDAHCAL